MIHEAIKCADTKYTLYFLLTSYVDTLSSWKNVPDAVKSLPISGKTDVRIRAEAMREVLRTRVHDDREVLRLGKVAQVFDVASNQLEKL